MKKYFLAKAQEGKEFLFVFDEAMFVGEKQAKKVCEYLNQINYNLKSGQVWHIFENNFYYNDRINREIKVYKNNLKVYRV